MKSETFLLLKDIFLLLFFLLGTLWMWSIIRFNKETQIKWEKIFERTRWRYKWLFLIGLLIIAGAIIWRRIIA